MEKLILEEKLSLNEKISLEEKLTLDEDYNDSLTLVRSYPDLYNLITRNKDYAQAFSQAGDNNELYKQVIVSANKPLNDEAWDTIQRLCDDHDLKLITDKANNIFGIIAEDTKGVDILPDVLNYLKGKDYINGNGDSVTPVLDKVAKIDYYDDAPEKLQDAVVDLYLNNEKLNNKLDTGATEIFKKICRELGFDEYHNPFQFFITHLKDQVQINQGQMASLNNLYARRSITKQDFSNLEDIIYNEGLYKNNPVANDFDELVSSFKEASLSARRKYFGDNNQVRAWKDIRKDIGLEGTIDDAPLKIRKNASRDTVNDFVDSLPDELRDMIAQSIEDYGSRFSTRR